MLHRSIIIYVVLNEAHQDPDQSEITGMKREEVVVIQQDQLSQEAIPGEIEF